MSDKKKPKVTTLADSYALRSTDDSSNSDENLHLYAKTTGFYMKREDEIGTEVEKNIVTSDDTGITIGRINTESIFDLYFQSAGLNQFNMYSAGEKTIARYDANTGSSESDVLSPYFEYFIANQTPGGNFSFLVGTQSFDLTNIKSTVNSDTSGTLDIEVSNSDGTLTNIFSSTYSESTFNTNVTMSGYLIVNGINTYNTSFDLLTSNTIETLNFGTNSLSMNIGYGLVSIGQDSVSIVNIYGTDITIDSSNNIDIISDDVTIGASSSVSGSLVSINAETSSLNSKNINVGGESSEIVNIKANSINITPRPSSLSDTSLIIGPSPFSLSGDIVPIISIDSGYVSGETEVDPTANIEGSTYCSLTVKPSVIGYHTGSGNSVTQTTSKSTSVTINSISGQIVTHNASLAANTSVTFQMGNTSLLDSDNLTLNISGDCTAGAYRCDAHVMDGVAYITVENRTGGSLAEEVSINFYIFKTAIA